MNQIQSYRLGKAICGIDDGGYLFGYLLDVNLFDQPNVKSYKVETRKILKK